jgi:hypothetical protein
MIFLILTIIFSLNLLAQDENLDKLPYDDAPPGVEEEEYFALGAGYGLAFNFVNIDNVNSFASNYIAEEFPSPIVLNGGMMFFSLPWAGSRISIWSLSGVSEVKNDTSFASLSSSYFGLGYEYGYVITKTLALVGGINVSWSSNEFQLSNLLADEIIWDGMEVKSQILIIKKENNTFFPNLLSPNLGVEWAITDFLMFRLNAAYNYSFEKDEWTVNNIETRTDVFKNVDNDGLVVSAGLFIGLFNY